LIAVPPSDVASYWPAVRKELDRLSRRGTDGWIPEDVYLLLRTNAATLYVQDGVEGFAILQLFPNYSGKRLHIWIACLKDDPLRFMDEIVALARQYGASKITYESPRAGWAKRAERLGFKAMATMYERRL